MLKGVLLLLVIGAAFYVFANPLAKVLEPCAEPIRYAIGSFDRQFGLSYENFLSALSEAEQVWESALDRELFAHSPQNGELAVNLIYDYRQEVTNELSQIEHVVENSESAYRTLEKEYVVLKAEHAQRESLYQSQLALFDQHNASYAQSVEAWNNSSRTNKQQFQALESERTALEKELAELKQLELSLNSIVREVNAKVGELNRLAKSLNLNVQTYNTVGASRGDTFAGGLYIVDSSGDRIDIYEFSSHDKLVRVLAHELGHALGLEHIDDKEAIMYYLNEGNTGRPSEADIESLKLLCKIN